MGQEVAGERMMSAEADRVKIIKDFWRGKAREESNRWTGKDLLEFELDYLNRLLPGRRKVLDLGAGHGELSRRYLGSQGELTAVDFEEAFGHSYARANHSFVNSSVADFSSSESWDLVLLMGVVTHLTESEATKVYKKIAQLVGTEGVAFIKHQVGKGEEKIFQGFSSSLESEYWARYPSFKLETLFLKTLFQNVEVLRYPPRFNKWPDTMHVGFICSNPSRVQRNEANSSVR